MYLQVGSLTDHYLFEHSRVHKRSANPASSYVDHLSRQPGVSTSTSNISFIKCQFLILLFNEKTLSEFIIDISCCLHRGWYLTGEDVIQIEIWLMVRQYLKKGHKSILLPAYTQSIERLNKWLK